MAVMQKLLRIICCVVGISLIHSSPVLSLSCSYYDELANPVDLIYYENIVEAEIKDVKINVPAGEVVANGGATHLGVLGMTIVNDDRNEMGIEFTLDTKEVFRGKKISRFFLGQSTNVLGAPYILDPGEEEKQQLEEEKLFPLSKSRRGSKRGVERSSKTFWFDDRNSGRLYKKLKGRTAIFLGSRKQVLCTDNIIEIEEHKRPDLLRGFLRCLNPAMELAERLKRDRKHLNGLPARWCQSTQKGWTYGTRNAPNLDGKCRPEDPRLSWFEDMIGEDFLDRTKLAIHILCPYPLSSR